MKKRDLGIIGLCGLVTTLVISCGSDSSGPPPPDPPVAGTVSETIVSPGDTLLINGSKFAASTGDNTVTFKNPISAIHPFQASTTQLHVVVDKDATSGPVTVTTAGGSDQTESVEVQRGVGDVFVFGGTGTGQVLTLPNPTVTTRYLVIPHATNSAASYLTNHSYTIATTSAPPAVAAPSAEIAQTSGHIGAREWFETQRWEQAGAMVERFGAAREPIAPLAAPEAAAAPFRQFYVLKLAGGDQNFASSYAHITAELRYDGSKCMVYADVETLMTGNFTQTHFNTFGQTFDNSIEATNVSYFGTYSDIDGNGKVILLVSPVVNRLEEPGGSAGFIAGFFNPRDLYKSPPVPAGTTNYAEIVYLLAADPTGVWDGVFPVDATASENLGTIPHEHQHLTSFSHRIFHEDGVTQVIWLEEGMAHMAEDLNGDNSSNQGRGKLWRADPGAVSLEDIHAPLEQRGGIYLMLRLLVDHYGTGILKRIVQSKCTGRACIQNVTGVAFYDLLGEFLAAQYLSGQGITPDPDDRRFNYATIDLADFGPLKTTLHVAGGADATGTVHLSSGDFHIYTGVLGEESKFTFTNPGGMAKLRDVVVRIQ